MSKYTVHFDDGHQAYWIGFVARFSTGEPSHVQQWGNYYQRQGNAQRIASKLNQGITA